MPPRNRRHPKYKAFFDHQLRIMQEKFPFLNSQQIKAKILSTWKNFSLDKKNEWGTRLNNGNSSQGSDGTGMSLYRHQPPPRHHKEYQTVEIPTPPENSTKNAHASKPYQSTPAVPDLKPNLTNHRSSTHPDLNVSPIQSPPHCVSSPHHNGHRTQEMPSRSRDSTKKLKVRFSLPNANIQTAPFSQSSKESSDASTTDLEMWPLADEFNSISRHQLIVEQQVKGQDSETSEDEQMSEERNVWPTLFGDTTYNWRSSDQKETKDQKEQPMCSLFQEAEPGNGRYFSIRRSLLSASPSDENTKTDIFDEDVDYFA